TKVTVASQQAVVGGLELFDELRLFQQCADLASRLDPVDASYLLAQAQFAVALVVRGKVRQHPAAQARALADVERQAGLAIALAVEEIDARGVGQAGKLLGVQVR